MEWSLFWRKMLFLASRFAGITISNSRFKGCSSSMGHGLERLKMEHIQHVSNNRSGYNRVKKQGLKGDEEHEIWTNLNSLYTTDKFIMKRSLRRAIGTEMVMVRRSGRIANLPAPVYKEITLYELAELPRGKRKYNYRRSDLANRVYAFDEEREYATTKAEELEANLEGDHPSFVKPMLPSHVTSGFWLGGLPGYFYRNHLPKNDGIVTLIDEEGEEFSTVYLAYKIGLSGGWRGVSLSHELVDGDALDFQLIEPIVFKVHIIRCRVLIFVDDYCLLMICCFIGCEKFSDAIFNLSLLLVFFFIFI